MKIEQVLNVPIHKVWAKFVIASVIGVVLNTIYTMVDGIFVGQGVGEVGLASVNIVWPAVTVIVGTGLMIGIGSSSIIAIYIGKQDKESAQKCLGISVTSIVLIGAIIMILGFMFREPILKMLGAEKDTIENARDYYSVIYLITIPYLFSTALNPIVRADGRPQLSMMMIGIGAICNIILDWVFVMKLGYGVKGAAMATSASIFISTVVSLYYFVKGNANIKIKKEYLKIDVSILKEILKIGFVSFAIQLSYGIILFVQNKTMYLYGNTVDVAIYTVATYINCFLVNTCMGISQGLQPLIGYHYGANKIKRMRQLLYITIGVCAIGGTLVYIGINSFGRELIQIFGISSENIEFAYSEILIYCLGSPVIGIIFAMSGYYQAIGKNIYANILSIGRGFLFQFILTMILPPIIGVRGVFLSLPLAELITLTILGMILTIEKYKNHKSFKYKNSNLEQIM
ncbi:MULTISPECIES: MATE family efflux transporter [Romboutsia]|uniref:Multidrug export protein MepA n=1 Tax=Romboutsia hominis TaxID=1507512 RepID=A0A2P2BUV0_9FIRM|nr:MULTISPECIES: MATE family efflux transporter [Romboutsia]MDB8789826.1 MATE family efflux transporter [Romboutsia sp. 1001216sp1]MDB8802960.1 MATE family efflux transporter [Romboutsia sp. 1001216sp1]MDB8805854.1 MATE family efflux transporter [Romboutsia sp. 1001216sp1]MDB8808305.1 MATE family efflux transporter [Romboutsia sp. 1001216sp1]MDB8811607.1 MATE family efflux transporter [Romboutsia sp. 1001216sp1]